VPRYKPDARALANRRKGTKRAGLRIFLPPSKNKRKRDKGALPSLSDAATINGKGNLYPLHENKSGRKENRRGDGNLLTNFAPKLKGLTTPLPILFKEKRREKGRRKTLLRSATTSKQLLRRKKIYFLLGGKTPAVRVRFEKTLLDLFLGVGKRKGDGANACSWGGGRKERGGYCTWRPIST